MYEFFANWSLYNLNSCLFKTKKLALHVCDLDRYHCYYDNSYEVLIKNGSFFSIVLNIAMIVFTFQVKLAYHILDFFLCKVISVVAMMKY
jgi:hypothetical protein